MTKRNKQQADGPRRYDVGYGKPPAHSRFKPGRSGNPRGRPRGAKNVDTLIRELWERKVRVKEEGGQTKRLSLGEALLLRLSGRALKGDDRATRLLLDAVRNADLSAPAVSAPLPENDRQLLDDALQRLMDEKEKEEPADPDPDPLPEKDS